MRRTKTFFSLLFSVILLSTNLHAQSFTSSVNSTTVPQNEPFQVVFQFGGDNINALRSFRAPDFKNFEVLSGPNQSTSMQIINGAVSASLTYSFYLQAPSQGRFTIGSASIDFKGKTLRTQPITITVTKGQSSQNGARGQQRNQSAASQSIGDNVFIRAVADKQKVLKGEQITITYKLYTRMDISSPQISKLPTYQGFWAEELDGNRTINFTTEVYNGKQYHVGVLKKAALFPTQTGQLSVTPFELKIPVIVPKQRRRGDIFDEFFNDPFFNQGQTVEYTAKSNVLKIDVLPLPGQNVPNSFNGAVGEFSFKAEVDKNTVKANEPVSLKLTVSGTGNISLLELKEPQLPSGFEKYDPKVNDQVNRSGSYVNGQKTIEYLLVPRAGGQKEIPPIEFSYFNPRTKRYVTVTSPAFSINVQKGDGTYANTQGFNKEDVKLLGEDIRYIKTGTESLSKNGGYMVSSFWFWAAAILPALLLAGVISWKRKNDRLEGNVQLMKYTRAEKMARNRLKTARKSMEMNNQQEFYSDISLALFGYLEDKLHIPKASFTLESALERLKDSRVPEDLIGEVKQAVEKCEFVRFAPMNDGASAMKEMYDQAVNIIVDLEKNKV
ncbi:MAG: protein BatD [Ignavibacteria bacterium]|nr:protein BatD [Ignavibacteria bacterium]MCU7512710.1 protein BatD [Ignavibacteria bacterium]